jgi:hypothetical protein
VSIRPAGLKNQAPSTQFWSSINYFWGVSSGNVWDAVEMVIEVVGGEVTVIYTTSQQSKNLTINCIRSI